MSAEPVRLLFESMEARDWEAAAAQLHEEVVVDYPHTGERIRGRESFMAIQRYPEGGHIHVLRVVAAGDTAVSEVRVDHGETTYYCAGFNGLRGGRIYAGTEYWVEARSEEPPGWRAQWTGRT
ncbi:MAG: nuclear transport factor 2 family protein [Gaiellaceae bacterium]